jgi:hypothetical protein
MIDSDYLLTKIRNVTRWKQQRSRHCVGRRRQLVVNEIKILLRHRIDRRLA